MRIATWNCYRGDCLVRAAELEPLNADVAVIQECSQPAGRKSTRYAWFGTNPAHGVGVVARRPFKVTPGPSDPRLDHTAFPAIVSGPTRFHVLAVWALPRPTYVRALLGALDVYAEFLKAAPSIVVGDFNCFAQWRGKPPSKYHVAPERDAEAPERPTHFWRWRERNPFHIDYCFVPAAWGRSIRSVHIGDFAEQHWRSDHRPVVVDVDLPYVAVSRSGKGM